MPCSRNLQALSKSGSEHLTGWALQQQRIVPKSFIGSWILFTELAHIVKFFWCQTKKTIQMEIIWNITETCLKQPILQHFDGGINNKRCCCKGEDTLWNLPSHGQTWMKISHRKTDGASDDLLIKANMILDCIRQDILKQKKGNTGYRNLAPDFMLKKDYSSKHHVQER